ncbi:MAG: hypothetical protein M3447_09820 [Acidobacteriota bacterium]|nr:hypothetical protein [Acidobacteriota bacterium]
MSAIEPGDDQGLNVTRERSEARGETFYSVHRAFILTAIRYSTGAVATAFKAEVIFKL